MGVGERLQRGFPTTHWSLVEDAAVVARSAAEPARPTSLAILLSRYVPALRAHLVLGKSMQTEDADDLLQSFITSRVLEQDLLSRVDRNRGRFRSYLLTVLDRYHVDWRRSQQARRRHIESGHPDAEADAALADGDDPFAMAWARALLNHATERTREHFQKSNRNDLWEVFRLRVLDPILHDFEPPRYEVLSRRLGYATASQACSAVLTAKRTFARVLRDVIAEYADDPDLVDDELNDLHRILATGHS